MKIVFSSQFFHHKKIISLLLDLKVQIFFARKKSPLNTWTCKDFDDVYNSYRNVFLRPLPILNSWLMGTSLIRIGSEKSGGFSSVLMRGQSRGPFRTNLAPPTRRWKSITYSRSAFGVLPRWRLRRADVDATISSLWRHSDEERQALHVSQCNSSIDWNRAETLYYMYVRFLMHRITG